MAILYQSVRCVHTLCVTYSLSLLSISRDPDDYEEVLMTLLSLPRVHASLSSSSVRSVTPECECRGDSGSSVPPSRLEIYSDQKVFLTTLYDAGSGVW